MLTIRKAELRDVPAMHVLINHYAAEQVLLPRTLGDLCANLAEFIVAEEDGRVVGCGALKFYSPELAEIRSLCVETAARSNGIGRAVTERLLDEAARSGLKTVFALTVAPEFFSKLGFREAPRERFPSKVWLDCLQCQRYDSCNEKAVALELVSRHSTEAESPAETVEVPSSS